MRISDWSSDVCSSDLGSHRVPRGDASARVPDVLRDLGSKAGMGNGERNMLPRPFSSVTLWERPKPRASAPSPAKAGGEAARLRTIGSRANERTPAVLAGDRKSTRLHSSH